MVDCRYFLNHCRTPCAIGEPDARHCGKNQYPPSPCNLDLIGRGEPWRAVVDYLVHEDLEFPGCLVGRFPEGGRYVYPPITYIPPTGAIEVDWAAWARRRRCGL